METWKLLTRELNHYGVHLIDSKKCKVGDNDSIQGTIKTVRWLNSQAGSQKKVLKSLWDEVVQMLQEESTHTEIIDDNMTKLFVFSLKDFIKYLLSFEGAESTKYYDAISKALSRDINSFSKNQVYSTTDYKLSIDWISRSISRLLYLSDLLSFASMGRKRISEFDITTAAGIAGPWSRLQIPMEERKFPFGYGLKAREKGKQKQDRYVAPFDNYNNDGSTGEGHYWREMRNEPFSWFDREDESPYPSMRLNVASVVL